MAISNQLARIMAHANAGKQLNAPTQGMQKVVNADGTVTEIPYMEDRFGRRTVMTRQGPQVLQGHEGKDPYGDLGGKIGNVLGGLINKGRLGRQERIAEKSVAEQELASPTFAGAKDFGRAPYVPTNQAELEKARERMSFEMPKEKIDYFDMSGVGRKSTGEMIVAANNNEYWQTTLPGGGVIWKNPANGEIVFDSRTMSRPPSNPPGQPASGSLDNTGVFKPPPKELTPDQQAAERIHGDPNVTVNGRDVNGVATRKMTSAEYLAALKRKGEAEREGPEKTLRQEYTKNTNEFGKIDSAFGRLQSSLSGTGAGDLSLIFQYMKILDPGSTVREGEFASAANAGGVDSKVIGIYNKIVDGSFLSPIQRIDFYQRARDLYAGAAKKYDYTRDMFTGLAKAYDLTGEDINKVIYPRDSARQGGSNIGNLLDGFTLQQVIDLPADEISRLGGQTLKDDIADYIEGREQNK